jgi:hypothetical protein
MEVSGIHRTEPFLPEHDGASANSAPTGLPSSVRSADEVHSGCTSRLERVPA